MAPQCSQDGQSLRCWSWAVPLAPGHEGSGAGGQPSTEPTPAASATGPLSSRPRVLGARPRRVTGQGEYQVASPFLFPSRPCTNPHAFTIPLPQRQTQLPSVLGKYITCWNERRPPLHMMLGDPVFSPPMKWGIQKLKFMKH